MNAHGCMGCVCQVKEGDLLEYYGSNEPSEPTMGPISVS